MSEAAEVADLLALVVHDLRNPVASIGANISFVRDATPAADTDVAEALEDIETALGELIRGLDQLGWVGRWLGGHEAMKGAPGDARSAVRSAIEKLGDDAVRAELPEAPVGCEVAGEPLSRLVELLVRNCRHHAGGPVLVRLSAGGVLEIIDEGPPVAPELRAKLFTVRGQSEIKGRAGGRYARVVGLLAARALADGMGACIEADADGDASVFRVTLSSAG